MAEIDVQKIIADAVAASGQGGSGANAADLPIIPLWLTRPANAAPKGVSKSGAGSSAAADRGIADKPPLAGNVNPMWVTGAQPTGNEYSSMTAAEGHWMDMSTEDRMTFAKAAEKAGVWKASQGADALFQAWGKAVGWAGKYNNLHQDDKSKWLSPFEAVTNMQIAGMADDGRSHDGFSTEATVQQFSPGQLQQQAKQILQQELGRNPTDSEMKSYTAAVNAAARANPQQVTQQQTLNPDGSQSTDRVVNGGVDPNAIIQDMASGTQESDAYKSAAVYLPALQQAIGAFTHM
jgi:hypothetical protein